MTDRRFQVFQSSTFVDLVAERLALTQALLRMRQAIPAGMELFSADNRPPWDVITKILDVTDYVVLMLAGRYGSLGDDGRSYTEREYDYAYEHGIPVLAFVHEDPQARPARSVDSDPAAVAALAAFRAKVEARHTTITWSESADLIPKVTQALYDAFTSQPRPGWIRAQAPSSGGAVAAPVPGAVVPPDLQVEVTPLHQGQGPFVPLTAEDGRIDEFVVERTEELLSALPKEGLDTTSPYAGLLANFSNQQPPGLRTPSYMAALTEEHEEDRTVQEYRAQVATYGDRLHRAVSQAREVAAAKHLPRFSVAITNPTPTNYTSVAVVVHLEGAVRATEPQTDDVDALADLPSPPRTWGPYRTSRLSDFAIQPPSFGAGSNLTDFGPSVQIENGGSVTLTYPPIHLRPNQTYQFTDEWVVLLIEETMNGPLQATWTATATNRDGQANGSFTIELGEESYDPWADLPLEDQDQD